MSRSGPYQGEPGRQPYGRPPQNPQQYQGGYPPQRGYEQPGYRDPYQQQDPYQQAPQRRPGPPPPERQRPSYDDDSGFRFRLPGLGLILTLLGLVVQVLSLLVLPWLSASAAGGETLSLPRLWDLVSDLGASGFGGWYVVLFTYPLAALGILLALTSVLESVAMKFVWAGLAIVGVGYLVLKYGLLQLFSGEGGVDLSSQELTTLVIAVAALVLVIFMIRTAMVMFRRIAGVVLLGLAAVHVYAMQDFADTEALSIGAYGPALGYVLSGVAALVGPRRLTPG